MKKCENCRFWDFFSDEDGFVLGECRRHAPKPVQELWKRGDDPAFLKANWRLTEDLDWCGEHQPKEEPDS